MTLLLLLLILHLVSLASSMQSLPLATQAITVPRPPFLYLSRSLSCHTRGIENKPPMSDPGKRRKEKGQAKENTLGLGQCRIGVTLPLCTASTSCAVKRPSSGVADPLSRQFPPTYHIQTFSPLPLSRPPPPPPHAARASCLPPFLLFATFPSFRKRFKRSPDDDE